jgi:O-antigen ligase
LDKASESKHDQRGLAFAAIAGFFFFVALLKFGNPVILESLVTPPENFYEFLYLLWPIKWGYFCVIPVIIIGLFAIKPSVIALAPRWVKYSLFLPLAWLLWQFIAATQTVDASLTSATLKNFTVCVVLFYLGFFALGRVQNPWPLWLFLAIALLWIVRVGFDQHFGGLVQTRKFFYEQPNWQQAPPEFLKKLASNRIYSTLFYPNTLAGALLLLVPITIAFVCKAATRFRPHVRCLIATIITIPAVACLYWSGSKAGWLIALLLALLALIQSNLAKRTKIIVIAIVLVGGLAGFGLRHAQFFQRGATSVVARSDYWRAALVIGKEHLLLGTGPGTFAIPYGKIKSPDAEMARLVHNDYLQQLSDSGIPGFTLYSAWIIVLLVILYRYSSQAGQLVTLGLLGILFHQTVEFHLYIPAIAWLMFFLLGWTVSRAIPRKAQIPQH